LLFLFISIFMFSLPGWRCIPLVNSPGFVYSVVQSGLGTINKSHCILKVLHNFPPQQYFFFSPLSSMWMSSLSVHLINAKIKIHLSNKIIHSNINKHIMKILQSTSNPPIYMCLVVARVNMSLPPAAFIVGSVCPNVLSWDPTNRQPNSWGSSGVVGGKN